MKEILISAVGFEAQAAIVEQEKLIHFFSESLSEKSSVGNIYLGTVVRVLPGMQAAFVEIGLERTAFLHVRDIVTHIPNPSIESLVHQGKQLLVQIIKDPIGTKGARLTTEIILPATHLVYRPYEKNNGISQKIETMQERERLQSLVAQLPLKGLIARTAAEDQSLETLKRDSDYLEKCWTYIQQETCTITSQYKLIYEELILPYRLLRDFAKYPIKKIVIDEKETFDKVNRFLKEFLPHLTCEVELDTTNPIFERYNILEQFKDSLKKEVALKSGGSVIIEQTESMVTIDVNTSKFVGKKNHEETILKTNTEAARLIAHQIQLRGLGGIIVIDFIDMTLAEDRLQIYHVLKEALKNDIMPTHILPMSELGLIQMTRKRTTESFSQKYFKRCSSCSGEGQVLEPSIVAFDIMYTLMQTLSKRSYRKFVLISSPSVIQFFENKKSYFQQRFNHLELECQLTIDHHMAHNKFEIIPLKDSNKNSY